MDDTENILGFPNSKIVRNSDQVRQSKGGHEVNKEFVNEALFTVTEHINSVENLKGVVILAFEEGTDKTIPICREWFAGELSVSEVYIMLDRIKNDLLNTLEDKDPTGER
jgi:hypothetical protein|tara:strand:+ start:1665 stop:1994 length:330 start_codon:yes stop_codon:yes gene_type:complete